MLSRKTLFITTAIVVVLAIPTVAWALTGPFDTDLPAVPGAQEAEPYDWMSQMHGYMWNDGQLPEDFPAEAGWMDQMHGYMWNNGQLPEGHPAETEWMDQMHDYMWNDGELPEGHPVGSCPMSAGMWGGR
jgi:hypothetical protein